MGTSERQSLSPLSPLNGGGNQEQATVLNMKGGNRAAILSW